MHALHAAGMLLRIFGGPRPTLENPVRLLTFGLDPSLSHLDEKSASFYRAAPVQVAVYVWSAGRLQEES